MDEEAGLVSNPWPAEDIQSGDKVRRHFSVNRLTKNERRFPPESEFIIRDGEDGLSTYWDKHIDLKDIYLTIALSYNYRGVFKDYTGIKVFEFLVDSIRKLSLQVTHSPSFFGNPSSIGYPNNRSHSLITATGISEEDFVEIRLNLATYCQLNYATSFLPFDVTTIKKEVQELRDKGNDTHFHKI